MNKSKGIKSKKFIPRDEKGRIMSKQNFTKKLKNDGISYNEFMVLYEESSKKSKQLGIPTGYKKIYSKGRELADLKKREISFTIEHQELIDKHLNRHLGTANLNGKDISKPKLTEFLYSYFQNLDRDVWKMELNVTIKGTKIFINLDDQLNENLKKDSSEITVRDKNGNSLHISSDGKNRKKDKETDHEEIDEI